MDAKKLKIANIVCWGIVVVLAVVLGVLVSTSSNRGSYKSLDEAQSAIESTNKQATSDESGTSSNDGGSQNSNSSSSSSNANNGSSGSSQSGGESGSTVEKLTATLKAEGYDTVVQGEVKMHADQYDSARTYVTYYIRLTEPVTISGYQATQHTTRSTQTLCASVSNEGMKFSNEDAIRSYFSKYNGKTVLVGLKNDTQSVQFASGTSCSFTLHSSSECDLTNHGHVTYLSDFQMFEIS